MMSSKKSIVRSISIIVVFTLGMMFISVTASAQGYMEGRRGFFDNWRMNINLGTNLFYGDIQQYKYAPYKDDWRMAYGIVFRKQLSPSFSVGLQLLNGKLHGTRFNYLNRDVMFDASVFEWNVNTTIDLIHLFAGYNPDRRFSVYGLFGLGFSNWKSKLKDYNTNEIISLSGYTGKGPNHRTTEVVVPFGGGLRFDISDKIGLNIESTLHAVNSDRLDAWKSHFKYDFYNYTSLGLYYNFNTMGYVGRDPAKAQARYDRRLAKQQQRELRDYERSINTQRQQNLYQQKYLQAKTYQDTRKSYKRKAEEDLRYYQKKTRQDIQPSTIDYYEYQKKQSLEAFWDKHSRGDLPEVVEYDIVAVYSRLKDKEPSLQELYAEEDLTRYVMPSQEEDIVLISPEQAPVTQYQYPETQTTTSQSHVLTDTPYNPELTTTPQSGVIYKIQLLAKTSGRANTEMISSNYGIVGSIDEEYRNGVYRYVVGSFTTYKEALNYAKIMKNRGISDAFVVAYKNGIRVPLRAVLE